MSLFAQQKPSAQIAHAGGELFAADSKEFEDIQEFVRQLDAPVECEETGADDGSYFASIDMLDATDTWRKATLQLAGRRPSSEEISYLNVAGESALDELLDELRQLVDAVAHLGRHLGLLGGRQLGERLDEVAVDEQAEAVEPVAAAIPAVGDADHVHLKRHGLHRTNEQPTEIKTMQSDGSYLHSNNSMMMKLKS